jgi:hypothetical protein
LAESGAGEKLLLDKIFGLAGQVDKEFVFAKLKTDYVNRSLDNAHQLSFVLLYAKLENVTLDSFQIDTVTASLVLDNLFLYAPDKAPEFLPAAVVLAEKYKGLSSILLRHQRKFILTGIASIFHQPYIRQNLFYLPAVDSINPNSWFELFEYLFDEWLKEREFVDTLKLTEGKLWKSIIGFEPTLSIFGSGFTLPSEIPPTYINEWINKGKRDDGYKERYDFLKTLGVSLTGSDIVQIRKFLFSDDGIIPTRNHSIPKESIFNTLLLAANANYSFPISSPKIGVLKDLYIRILSTIDFSQVPVPVISINDTNSLNFRVVAQGKVIQQFAANQLEKVGFKLEDLANKISVPIVYGPIFPEETDFSANFEALALEFAILDTVAIKEKGEEWNRDYYREWKKRFPSYIITPYPGNIPYVVQYEGKIFSSTLRRSN